MMHGASKLMNGLWLGAHLIKDRERRNLLCAQWTIHVGRTPGRNRRVAHKLVTAPHIKEKERELRNLLWGGLLRVCTVTAWSCITFHSLTICVPDQRSTHGVPTCWWHTEWEKEWMFLAHTLAKRKDWWIQRVGGQAFILMEGTTGG